MQFEALFRAAREKPVAAALIGAGEFGLSLIAQSRRMQGLKVLAAADKDLSTRCGGAAHYGRGRNALRERIRRQSRIGAQRNRALRKRR